MDHNEDYLERYHADRHAGAAVPLEQRSAAAWHLDMLRDMWHRRRDLLAEHQALSRMGAKGKQSRLRREAIFEHLNAIHRVFGQPALHHDAVVARWDAMLAKGQVPDFKSR